MRESVGKAIAREYFYKHCLPNWLSHEELRHGNFLVLLGEKPRELVFTDSFGAPRSQIYSVERDRFIYKTQHKQGLNVHLWEGELKDYLLNLIHGNDNFLVFNLDIEGSYLSQLDAAMTPVLLFTWRNPKTVVATYSSVGRDTETIWEGIKSLVIFLWLRREATLKTFSVLVERYKKGRFDNPVFMALRDFFWMRSLLEHSLIAGAMVGVTAPIVVSRWFKKMDVLWNQVSLWRRNPLRLCNILKALDIFLGSQNSHNQSVFEPPACIGSSIASLKHMVYNAAWPWSQMCYFTTFAINRRLIHAREWLTNTLKVMSDKPLTFIDRKGIKHNITAVSDRVNLDSTLWRGVDLYEKFKSRELCLFGEHNHLSEATKVHLAAGNNLIPPGSRKEIDVKQYVGRDGELTDFGKQQIQICGHRYRELSTEQIIELLPRSVRKIPEGVIRAHIAVGRRKKK